MRLGQHTDRRAGHLTKETGTGLKTKQTSMNTYYGIFSSRGLWVEVVKGAKGGTKRVVLTGQAEAEKRAAELSKEHKRKYWVERVELKQTPPKK